MDNRVFNNLFFNGFSEETLRSLDLRIEERRFAEGMLLFEEGEPGEHLFLILEGEIRISMIGRLGDQETLADLGAGDCFGELALLDGRNRSARATALQPSAVGLLDRSTFDRFLAHSPKTSRHFAEVLSGALRSANATFIAKLREAERLSLLGTMMSAIVHDIRNPIATLGQVGYYLGARKNDPTLLELGRITEDALEQTRAMIQELLDYSRGKISLELGTFTMPEFLVKLDKQILQKMEKSGISVRRQVDYEGEILGDQQRLRRLFLNIIKNSWEAMTSGGTLTLRFARSGNSILIEIEDTGCGIERDLLKKVFEPFVTHGKVRGTGLGMAIAKMVVEAHQGTIRMESEVRMGTTCYISLPADQSASATRETSHS